MEKKKVLVCAAAGALAALTAFHAAHYLLY